MTAVLDILADPWAEPVMRRALLECLLLGVSGGLLGCWLVLYELSYSAESLAHALLPGLVGAALIGFPLLAGAAAGLAVAAAGVAVAGRTPLITRDTAVAIVVTTLLGLGAVLALSPSSPPGIDRLLFGDILGVGDGDLAAAAVLVAALTGALLVLHERLLAVGFDRRAAAGMGLRTTLVDAALLALLAGVLLVAVQGLGNLLVVALLIAPAAAARLVVRRIPAMMAVAVAIAVTAGAGGLYLSYYASTAAGASIAAVLVATFVAVRAAYDVH